MLESYFFFFVFFFASLFINQMLAIHRKHFFVNMIKYKTITPHSGCHIFFKTLHNSFSVNHQSIQPARTNYHLKLVQPLKPKSAITTMIYYYYSPSNATCSSMTKLSDIVLIFGFQILGKMHILLGFIFLN